MSHFVLCKCNACERSCCALAQYQGETTSSTWPSQANASDPYTVGGYFPQSTGPLTFGAAAARQRPVYASAYFGAAQVQPLSHVCNSPEVYNRAGVVLQLFDQTLQCASQNMIDAGVCLRLIHRIVVLKQAANPAVQHDTRVAGPSTIRRPAAQPEWASPATTGRTYGSGGLRMDAEARRY